LHGYAIITAVSERSNGVLELRKGTIYPALNRLERLGLLRSVWESVGDRVEIVMITHGEYYHTFHIHGHRWADNRTGLLTGPDDPSRVVEKVGAAICHWAAGGDR
ncbi:helix-turn-helix transcriptional regulator, partial [Streptomyces sp. BE147]|nr:helix-turn-helix transcriptional regulator [Streptomyces sp. BE147]